MNSDNSIFARHDVSIADQSRGLYHVFVRDLVLMCSIGIYPHEKTTPQRVRINIDLGVTELSEAFDDRYEAIVDYEVVSNRVREFLGRGHIDLVETMAEEIAQVCLENPRVEMARIRIEKIDIMPDAGSVGVEIERRRDV